MENVDFGYGYEEVTEGNYFEAGVIEGVKLTRVAYEPAKEGSENYCLNFVFTGSEGQEHSEKLFPIDKQYEMEKAKEYGKDPAKHLNNRIREMGLFVVQALVSHGIDPKGVFKGRTASFAEYANKVATAFANSGTTGGSKLGTVDLRIKLVYKSNGYLRFPKAYNPVIEAIVEGQDPKVVITKWDANKLERPTIEPNSGSALNGYMSAFSSGDDALNAITEDDANSEPVSDEELDAIFGKPNQG